MSREEYLWQNELKDLIWLELQAWHSDRSLSEEDSYLCMARESVATLLQDIMNYKFVRTKLNESANIFPSDCSGCLSMYCHACLEHQNEALKEVEELLNRLENAEALFPSSKAFGEAYELYNSPEFIVRVKSMCLWYNITKHQRLKLVILGRLLTFLENQTPISTYVDGNSIDTGSPSDSNSSSSSINEYLADIRLADDVHNVSPLTLLFDKKLESKTSPYRKYIENILKTRGLEKSVGFLDRLHYQLQKIEATLRKPENDTIFDKVNFVHINFTFLRHHLLANL